MTALGLGIMFCMTAPLRSIIMGNKRAAGLMSRIYKQHSGAHRKSNIDSWENFAHVDFRYAEMGHNNLGGKGPDGDPELMVFKNVTIYSGEPLDLVVKATSDYYGNASKNGIQGSFGQINVAPNTSVDLEFTFRDTKTMVDMVVPAFTFSFWDLDTGKRGGIETMTVGPIVSYYVTPETEVIATEITPDHWNFTGSTFGRYTDNPTYLEDLTAQQLNRGVEVGLAMQSSFESTFCASPNTDGRTFLFGGNSKLYYVSPPTAVGDCKDLTRLKFSNLMGGSLPQPGMRWGAVTEIDGKPVDLLVTADESYRAADAAKNGMNGEVININVAGNVTTTLSYKFVDPDGQPVQLSRFYLSFLDFDGPRNGSESAIVPRTYYKWFVAAGSTLKIEDTDAGTLFQSTAYGNEDDNPDKRFPLSDFQQSVSFSLFYTEATSEVTIQYTAENAISGRQLQVTGATQIPCPVLF